MKLLEHFKELSIYPQNAKELKGLILQLAIQGKLTAQWRTNVESQGIATIDNNAKTLLEQIKAEKAQLIKDKKIKKEKALPPISQEEIPFELPESWEWCRLNDISSINGGFAFKSSKYIEQGVRVIRISDFDENGLKNGKIVRYEYSDDLEVYRLEINNIIMAMTGGTVGKSYFIKSLEEPMVTNQRVATIKLIDPIYEAYVNCVIPTNLIQDVIAEAKNSTNDNISMSDIKNFKIPLPPLAEQKAIVQIVDTLFKEVEALEELTQKRVQLKEDFISSALRRLSEGEVEKEWAFLQQHFSTFMTEESNVKKLRECILQLAVQGKLTRAFRERHPELVEGSNSAKTLLQQIQAEKAQLIKDKKIKKEKALPPITKEEIPYQLPEGWEWCRLGDISSVRVGSTPARDNSEYWNGDIPWVSSGEVANNFIFDTKEKITQIALKESSVTIYPIGTVLVAMIGQGKTRGQTSILKISAGTNQNVGGIVIFHEYLISEYLWQYFLGRYEKTRSSAAGGNQPAINGTKIKMTLFPLPPLAEQQAIVTKVNELMALCDTLEQEIAKNKEAATKLMQSVLREVFQGKPDSVARPVSLNRAEEFAIAAEPKAEYK